MLAVRHHYGWVLVGTLGVTETISWGVLYYAFTVFLRPMEEELGWSRAALSGAFSLALLLAGLAAVPVGRWLDRHGPRLLMTAGSCAGVLLILAWSRVDDMRAFYLVWAGIGLTLSAVLYEPAFATVTAWFERGRARALTVVTLMAGFASTIFIPLAGWLIEVQGWRMALVTLAAILALGTVAPHALLLRRRPVDAGLGLDDARLHTARAPGGLGATASLSPGQALRDPSFRWLVLAFCLSTAVAIGTRVHFVAYLGERGLDVASAAAFTGLIGAMQVLGRMLLGGVGDRFPLHRTAAVALGLQPAALLALLIVPEAVGVLLFVAIFGSTYGAMTLIRPALVAGLYGRARFASIAGMLAFATTLAQAAAPLGAGAARDLFGSYTPLLWGFVGLSGAGALAVLRARPRA